MQNENSKQKTGLKYRAYVFSIEIIGLIEHLNQKDLATTVIAKQLLRSATSIGANIIEAQAGSSKRDFANFFGHALKSANETRFWLSLLKDSKKADGVAVEPLLKEAVELANMLGSSIITLKKKREF